MANLTTAQAQDYHVKQTLGGSCWLAVLACTLSAKLTTPNHPNENDLKLVARELGLPYEWANEASWKKMTNRLNETYGNKANISIADRGDDSNSTRDLIKRTVDGCGSIIFTIYTENTSKHDIAVLGIESVNSSDPLDDRLTVCDPEEDSPKQDSLRTYWAMGLPYIVTVV